MKNYTYLLGILCLCGFLVACGGGNSNADNTSIDSTATTSIAVPETNTSTPNPTGELSEEARKQAIEEATQLAKQLRNAYNKMKDKQAKYVEEVPFTYFVGIDVASAEFEITKINDQLTRVHVDYFEGSPVGGKRYFVNNGELFAVEILRLSEEAGEHGMHIVEAVSHICYYKGGKLAQIWDTNAQQEVDPKTVTWTKENLEQWEEVKKNL